MASSALLVPVGIIVAREKISHPWQTHRWRPVGIFLDAPQIADWRELRRDSQSTLYHAATLNLELYRKETTAYQVNLANGNPSVYVVLREDPDSDNDWPVEVHLVTASPFEAQSHGDVGFDTVEAVDMPDRLVGIVRDFISTHHKEEIFYKRKRDPHRRMAEDHKFGQEPIFELRDRISENEPCPDMLAPRKSSDTGRGDRE